MQFSAILLSLIGTLSLTHAAAPPRMNYQGFLSSLGGSTPVADSTGNSMEFRIFNVPTGGVALWSEIYNSSSGHFITTTAGVFNVLLGQFTPISLPFDEDYWLEVTSYESGSPELPMVPRQSLSTAPYAFSANTVPAAGISGTVGAAQLPSQVMYLDTSQTVTGKKEFNMSGVGAIYATSDTAGLPVIEASGAGIGVQGRGQTGTAGTATTGGIGVLASDGGFSNSIALRVSGIVKVDATSGVCDSSRSGSLRWNGSYFEYCDGISWNRMAPGITVHVGAAQSCPAGFTARTTTAGATIGAAADSKICWSPSYSEAFYIPATAGSCPGGFIRVPIGLPVMGTLACDLCYR